MPSRPLLLEASISELSPGGEGVAIAEIAGERRAIFVPGVVRGERVRLEVDPTHRPARGRLLAVIDPRPERVAPPCAHVDRCGGCDWMHLAPTEQATEHARIVEALLGDPPPKVHPPPRALGYRTRARVHIEATRRGVTVGMFARKSHAPVAVDVCVVLDPIVDRARAKLSAWLEGARGRGEASLSVGAGNGAARRAVLDLRWNGDPLPAAVFGRFSRAVTADEPALLAGARIFSGEVRVPATIGDPTPFIVAADGAPLRLASGGFSQANEGSNALLVARVAEVARSLPPGPCVELYAGAGNLTVLLARDRAVVAVEEDKEACEVARENLHARNLDARVITADAKAFEIPRPTRLVVLDPPREGARVVAEALAARAHARPAIIYVACDPPTLARDVRILTASGYSLVAVETFEMFPNTSHVETLVVLEPKARP